MKKMIDTVKENVLVSILLGVAVIGGSVTAGISSIETLDALVMTKAEHDADLHEYRAGLSAQATAIKELKRWNRCDRLERRSGELSDRLWRLHQTSNTAAITIRDMDRDLSRVKRQFNDLNCGFVLSNGG